MVRPSSSHELNAVTARLREHSALSLSDRASRRSFFWGSVTIFTEEKACANRLRFHMLFGEWQARNAPHSAIAFLDVFQNVCVEMLLVELSRAKLGQFPFDRSVLGLSIVEHSAHPSQHRAIADSW